MAKKQPNIPAIKVALVEVAKARANFESSVVGLQRSTEETIEARLREAITAGLTVDMFDQKHEVRKEMEKALAESYFLKQSKFAELHAAHNAAAKKDGKEEVSIIAFAQLHNAQCIADKKPEACFAEIPKSTRYNFFSAVRSFVEKPKAGLDLWGNKARAAMNDNKKKEVAKSGARHDVEKPATDAKKQDDKIKLSSEQVVTLADCMAVVQKYLDGNKVQAAGIVNEKLQEAVNAYRAMTGGKK